MAVIQSQNGSPTIEARSAIGTIRRIGTAPDTHGYTSAVGTKAADGKISMEATKSGPIGS